MPTAAEIKQQLTGPGGPFEVVTEQVRGRPMQVYKERMKALRQISEIAGARGDAPFIVYGDRTYSFTDFINTSFTASAGLQSFGVGHGDRVAVLSQNNPEWCLTFWGTVNIGAILVGLNGWWTTDEIIYGLQDSGSKVLVADAKRFERIAGNLDDCPDLEHVFLVDADPADFDPDGSDKRLHRFDGLLAAGADGLGGPPDTPIDEDDYAVIFYTSGTTGRPKGAISTHRSMIANLQNTIYGGVAGAMTSEGSAIPQTPGQTVALFTSPLFHVSGCHSTLVVGLLAGIKLVMIEGRFDPPKALGLIQDHGVTLWATVPTMVWRVCEFPDRHDYDTSSVMSVAFGGSPSADELQRKVRETFPNVRTTTNAYGLTESSSVATAISGQDAIDKPNSVGPPVPTLELKIRDPEGNEVRAGQTGEVTMYGPLIMAGYWNKPEATEESVRDGWLYTGDIGYVDADGYLYITDRKKDMIIRGGENIYCVEIENRLVEHPAIADAAVIGVPHPELGEEVKAVVQLEPGETLTEQEVRAWVAEALANFKVPAYVQLQDDKLPRNASGKLLKNVLRGEGEVSFAETM
jgi:long-chain acyl-CoA synthetase